MTTSTQTITEFLRDRIAEDEARIMRWLSDDRALREVEAKRDIMRNHPGGNACWHNGHGDPCWDLRALASVYAAHPDYRDEWRA